MFTVVVPILSAKSCCDKRKARRALINFSFMKVSHPSDTTLIYMNKRQKHYLVRFDSVIHFFKTSIKEVRDITLIDSKSKRYSLHSYPITIFSHIVFYLLCDPTEPASNLPFPDQTT